MRRDERGQATTELALVLPLVAVLLLLLAQVGLVLRDQLVLTHVAREAARAAAVEADPSAVRLAAERSSRLASERLEVAVVDRGEPGALVTVALRYRSPTDLPLVGPLVGDRTLTAEATMQVESP